MAKNRDWGSLQKMRSKGMENSEEYLRKHRYDMKPKSKAHAKYLSRTLHKLKNEPKLFWCHKCNKFKELEHEHI